MLVVIVTAAAILGVRAVNNSGIFQRNTIAATIDEHELDSVHVNYYYKDYVDSYFDQYESTYGESAGLFLLYSGLDTTKPLNTQSYNGDPNRTWADYFLAEVLVNVRNDYALYDKAMAEGFDIGDEVQQVLDFTEQELNYYATAAGFRNANAYLKAVYGPGSDAESYLEYTKIAYIASSYYSNYGSELTYDEEEVREHAEEYGNRYASYDFAYYYIDLYHCIEGGVEDENGVITHTPEQKAAAIKKAEDLANLLAESKNITEFDSAINNLDINADRGTVTSTKAEKTLYSQVTTELREWLSDDARTENNITVIPSTETVSQNGETVVNTLGYYVVLYLDRYENTEPLANVRHLLVKFEGGTTGTNGKVTYSDAEKAAAKAEAEALLQTWKDGDADEDSFIKLVQENSDDTASATNGGLIEDIHPQSNLVENFLNWSIDPSREVGDTDVIESEYGYHVMYYVSDDEVNYRDYMITETLRSLDLQTWFTEIINTVSIKLEESKYLNLDLIMEVL